MNDLIIIRGAGDISTGTICRLFRAGFPVLALETDHPSAIRRKAAFSEAVYDGTATVEDLTAVRIGDAGQAENVLRQGKVPLLTDPAGESIRQLKPKVLVDAILAKKNLGTHMEMADLTIALGPGFEAGRDVHYVIETMRGHNLGRIISSGFAAPNTGIPGIVGGYGAERVIHSPAGPGGRNDRDRGYRNRRDPGAYADLRDPAGDHPGQISCLQRLQAGGRGSPAGREKELLYDLGQSPLHRRQRTGTGLRLLQAAGVSVPADQAAQAADRFRIREGIRLIDEITVRQGFPVQDGGDMLRQNRGIRCDPGQGGEQFRTVAGFGDRFSDPGGAGQTDGQAGTGRDNRLPRTVRLQRPAGGPVGFHEDVIRLRQEFLKGKHGGRGCRREAASTSGMPGKGRIWVEVVRITVPGRRSAKYCRKEVFPPLPMTDTHFAVIRNSSKGLNMDDPPERQE